MFRLKDLEATLTAKNHIGNQSKQEILVGHQVADRYTALRDVATRHLKNFARKTLDMSRGVQVVQGDEIEEFWALKDVSFDVNEGDVLGIIGRNGAGKSTLLKILSRITEPTNGRVILHGRVASLLEVGTGFHPELTGRENVFLNGAILGMGRVEIKQKFDEIVQFAEVQKFLDTPVKRYSSGMYVRLAFAVAAHLEPEILVVDEVLAVGDAEFQKKCLGKMKDVATGGRTVIFVSHNMGAISALCNRAILLSAGQIEANSSVNACVDMYCMQSGHVSVFKEIPKQNSKVWLKSAGLTDCSGHIKSTFHFDEPISVLFNVEMSAEVHGVEVGVRVASMRGGAIFSTTTPLPSNANSKIDLRCQFEPKRLAPGNYSITIAVHIPGAEALQVNEDLLGFTVEETGSPLQRYHGHDYGVVFLNCDWGVVGKW